MLVSSYTTSIHCSSCLVKHSKPSQKSDFSNNNNHFILAQKPEEWPRSVSIYEVTVRLWLESPQRILCSCLMPGLKQLGSERARAFRSISSPFSLFSYLLISSSSPSSSSSPLSLSPLPSLPPSFIFTWSLHMATPGYADLLDDCRSLLEWVSQGQLEVTQSCFYLFY